MASVVDKIKLPQSLDRSVKLVDKDRTKIKELYAAD